jgi:hypothetical protein
MSRSLRPSFALLVLFAAGCGVDNNLGATKPDPNAVDTGDPVVPPDLDSGDDSGWQDSGEVVWPDYCDDRFFGSEAVPQDADCNGGPTTPDWSLETIWSASIGSGAYTPAVVGQLDDDDGDGDADEDDVPDVVLVDSASMLRVLDGSDGSTKWTRMLTNTMGSIPAIGDVTGDGFPEIVLDLNYSTAALRGTDGTTLWTGPSYSMKNKGSCGAHGIMDLDGDGDAEVYLGGQVINGQTGSLIGSGREGDGMGVGNSLGISIAADMDNDGAREVIVGNAAYDVDGSTIWANDGTDGTVAVADLDLDGQPEMVVVGNYGLIVQDRTGNELWTYDLGGASASLPVIADLDGDGYPEIVVPTSNELIVVTGDGRDYWSKSDSASARGRGGATAYDLNGDGAWEVIWAGPSGTLLLDGASGDTLTSISMSQPSCAGPVAIADVDADNHADIIAVDAAGTVRALRDTSGFTTARTVWHQADYSYTNVEDDGTFPADPVPTWELHNNFRAGPAIPGMQSLYPVIRDVCSDECTDGSVWIWYSVANSGNEDFVGNVELEVWGVLDTGPIRLDSATVMGGVRAGQMTEGAFLELVGVPTPLNDISIRIASAGSGDALECDTSDDTVRWGAPICP